MNTRCVLQRFSKNKTRLESSGEALIFVASQASTRLEERLFKTISACVSGSGSGEICY